MRLDGVEARVVGSLVEKQLTTPQQYPLTLNSLTLACNQSSNRDPVVNFSEQQVHDALDSLKQKGLVRFVLPSHGRSVVRYRHVLDEKLALDDRQMSLVAVLLLRGPQTVGELRARTERMATFESITAVDSDLEGLSRWEEPLVARLPRRSGQKEERWTHLLAETEPDPQAVADTATAVGADAGAVVAGEDAGGELAALRDSVEVLRREVDLLREEVLGLRLELSEVAERS